MEGTPDSVVSTDGTRIGFLTGGRGPTLLLVHGGMCSSRRWAALWPLLTRRFHVAAMDRRGRASSPDGHRYSLAAEYDDVAAVAACLTARQGTPIDVFGHSFGAVCALGATAGGAPVRRLALYEPPGPQTVTSDWLDRVRVMIEQRQFGRAMAGFLVDVVGLSRQQVDVLRTRSDGPDPLPIVERTLLREAEALTTVELRDLGAAVTQPVLLLLGEVGPPWADVVTHSLADALPAGDVQVLPGQGHEAVDTAPDLVAGRLERFLLDR